MTQEERKAKVEQYEKYLHEMAEIDRKASVLGVELREDFASHYYEGFGAKVGNYATLTYDKNWNNRHLKPEYVEVKVKLGWVIPDTHKSCYFNYRILKKDGTESAKLLKLSSFHVKNIEIL